MSFPAADAWLAHWRADPRACAEGICARAAAEGILSTEPLAAELGRQLVLRGWRVAVAESCTGGGLGAALTAVPGSSAWVEGGMITYSNAAKSRLLGVPGGLFAAHGAVSAAVVDAMVRGACAQVPADCGIAVSGVAGPGGGSVLKPVGTVWLAWTSPTLGGTSRCQGVWFPGDREAVRRGAVWIGLLGLLDLLDLPPPPGKI